MGSTSTRIRVAPLHPATPPLAHARLSRSVLPISNIGPARWSLGQMAHRQPAGVQSEIDVSADTAWVSP